METNLFEKMVMRIKNEEGFSVQPFWDNKQWTWGYGTQAPGGTDRDYWKDSFGMPKIDMRRADALLRNHLQIVFQEYDDIFNGHFEKINPVRRMALLDMIFNLGKPSFLHFRKMLAEIASDSPNWYAVAYHAWDSQWRQQVHNRADRVISELATGEERTA